MLEREQLFPIIVNVQPRVPIFESWVTDGEIQCQRAGAVAKGILQDAALH